MQKQCISCPEGAWLGPILARLLGHAHRHASHGSTPRTRRPDPKESERKIGPSHSLSRTVPQAGYRISEDTGSKETGIHQMLDWARQCVLGAAANLSEPR